MCTAKWQRWPLCRIVLHPYPLSQGPPGNGEPQSRAVEHHNLSQEWEQQNSTSPAQKPEHCPNPMALLERREQSTELQCGKPVQVRALLPVHEKRRTCTKRQINYVDKHIHGSADIFSPHLDTFKEAACRFAFWYELLIFLQTANSSQTSPACGPHRVHCKLWQVQMTVSVTWTKTTWRKLLKIQTPLISANVWINNYDTSW